MVEFENLDERHRKAVIDIFNFYVRATNFAYPTREVDYAFYDRFLENAKQLCGFAINDQDHNVIGFCQLKPHNQFSTFEQTVEITYFLEKSATGKGIGTIALNKLLNEGKKRGKRNVLASISGDNSQSISFHSKNGFIECGRFKGIGKKFGNDFDIVYMQKKI